MSGSGVNAQVPCGWADTIQETGTEGREMGRPRGPFVFWGPVLPQGWELGIWANLRVGDVVFCCMSRLSATALAALVALASASVVWAHGPSTIQATGSARARPGLRGAQARFMAQRGAQVVASRNLLLQDPSARQYVASGYRQVSGVARSHHYGPIRYLPDGRAVVTARRHWRH